MAVSSAVVAVNSTAATTLFTADSNGNDLGLLNTGSVDVYLGSSAVTSTSGFVLSTGSFLGVELGPLEVLFGRTSSTDGQVSYISNR